MVHGFAFGSLRLGPDGSRNSLLPRKLRVEHPCAMYHVMKLGVRREAMFEDGEDRERLFTEDSVATA